MLAVYANKMMNEGDAPLSIDASPQLLTADTERQDHLDDFEVKYLQHLASRRSTKAHKKPEQEPHGLQKQHVRSFIPPARLQSDGRTTYTSSSGNNLSNLVVDSPKPPYQDIEAHDFLSSTQSRSPSPNLADWLIYPSNLQTGLPNDEASRTHKRRRLNDGSDSPVVKQEGLQEALPSNVSSDQKILTGPATSQNGPYAVQELPPTKWLSESRHGVPYSAAEDQLLFELRQKGLKWPEIPGFFQGRTLGSLQVRYSTKLSLKKRITSIEGPRTAARGPNANSESRTTRAVAPSQKLLRRATGGAQTVVPQVYSDDESESVYDAPSLNKEAKLLQMMRRRETGTGVLHEPRRDHIQSEIQNTILESMRPTKFIDNASGDVATVAWSPDDRFFAGGGVVLMDENSMQYNNPRNLLLGDRWGSVRELPEHHIQRPIVTTGVNSLESMRQTQDDRLFTTVQMVGFSPDSQHLYSVSVDGRLNSYRLDSNEVAGCAFEGTHKHDGQVDLLTIGAHGIVATSSRSRNSDTIHLFRQADGCLQSQMTLDSRSSGTKDMSYASALKWAISPHNTKWLLAGFAQEKQRLYAEDNDLDIFGATCLFDGETGQRIDFGHPRNVFDVAWNPTLGPVAFAVASVGLGKANMNFGMHTVVRAFGTGQAGIRCSVELECPARDINDVVFCPYDENVIAAGSTDGKVYVWDIRFNKRHSPTVGFGHGNCVSVLPHDRKRWEVDTGVRFLSWGANSRRLFSGSSDGVVKAWDPYVNDQDSHASDVATFKSAVMSGAFNSDFTELLIGEDASRLTLLEVGASDNTEPERFSLECAPEQEIDHVSSHPALLESGEVVFENCGALPIRQAVQGPNYKPNRTLLTETEAELHKQALRFQRDLFHQRNRWKKLKRQVAEQDGIKVLPCSLDCGYTPRVEGDADEIPDTGRSADRIPDTVRGPPLPRRAAMLQGLTAKCQTCYAPARAPEISGNPTLCELCSFACFRCGGKADVSVKKDVIACQVCEMQWRADVLGYEIISQPCGRKVLQNPEEEKSWTELGDEQREHYLS